MTPTSFTVLNYSKLFSTNRVKILEDLRNCRPGFAFYMFPGDCSSNHPSHLVQVGSYSRSSCFKITFSNSLKYKRNKCLMSVWRSDEKLVIFASLISPSKIILFENIIIPSIRQSKSSPNEPHRSSS